MNVRFNKLSFFKVNLNRFKKIVAKKTLLYIITKISKEQRLKEYDQIYFFSHW